MTRSLSRASTERCSTRRRKKSWVSMTMMSEKMNWWMNRRFANPERKMMKNEMIRKKRSLTDRRSSTAMSTTARMRRWTGLPA
jgi:hypothetical protein